MAPKIIFVEGNIGSGKSTFLDMVSKHVEGAKVVYEPLDVWKAYTDENGKNILHHFYEDQKRYAYTFQTIAFLSRVERLREIKNSSDEYIFIERSIFSDREIFAKNCHLNGLMSKIEWDLYNSWFDWIKDMLDLPEASILYLRCEPEVSFSRATSRGRAEEAGVPFDYLKKIHERHEEWLIGNDKAVVVDASVNFRDNLDDLNKILANVL